MKTPTEFALHWAYDGVEYDRFVKIIAARDAEHESDKAALRAEVERLKGELAEARRLLGGVRGLGCFAGCVPGQCVHAQIERHFATQPAGQAQPTAKCGRCGNTEGKVVAVAGKLQFQCGHASCWPPTPIEPAEQAQGEAPTLEKLNARLRIEVGNRRDLSVRVDEMEVQVNARLDALETVVKRIDAEHAEMCPQHLGLEAPPETAAPATHAFVGRWTRDGQFRCVVCNGFNAVGIHAAPPPKETP